VRRLADDFGAAVVGYLLACVAAGFSIVVMMALHTVYQQWTDPAFVPSDMTALEQVRMLVYSGVFATIIVAATAIVPTVPVIAVLLVARLTDVFSCVVAGVAIGVSAVLIARRYILFMDRLELGWPIMLAGAVAGAVFWAVLRRMAPKPAAIG